MTSQQISAKLQFQIDALKASTVFDAYSGLTVEEDEGQIRVYDDYDGAIVPDPEATLEALKRLDPIDWDEPDNTEAFQAIWNAIAQTGGY